MEQGIQNQEIGNNEVQKSEAPEVQKSEAPKEQKSVMQNSEDQNPDVQKTSDDEINQYKELFKEQEIRIKSLESKIEIAERDKFVADLMSKVSSDMHNEFKASLQDLSLEGVKEFSNRVLPLLDKQATKIKSSRETFAKTSNNVTFKKMKTFDQQSSEEIANEAKKLFG